MDAEEIKKRIEAAWDLVSDQSITREKLESVRALIKGVNPKLDHLLAACSKTLADAEKVQAGEVVDLAAEHLPEVTQKDKKRKKAILLFLSSWKDLKNEINRVKTEVEKMPHEKTSQAKAHNFADIAMKTKGPLGILTLAAVIIVGAGLFFNNKLDSRASTPAAVSTSLTHGQKIQVITFNGKKLPLKELRVGHGPDCGAGGIPHYHALNDVSVKALDGAVTVDPGACGFGKLQDTRIEEVEAN